MKDGKKNIKDYNPSFEKYSHKLKKMITIYYEKSWYCKAQQIIHNSEKQTLECKFCSKIYYSEEL